MMFEGKTLAVESKSATKRKFKMSGKVLLCLSEDKGKRHIFIRFQESMYDLVSQITTRKACREM